MSKINTLSSCGNIISVNSTHGQNVIYSNGTSNTLVSSANSTWSTFNINTKSVYIVFGEEIKVDGPKDTFLAQNLSLITVLGKTFYDELIKNGFTFTKEIEVVLQRNFRNEKINSVLNDRGNENKII